MTPREKELYEIYKADNLLTGEQLGQKMNPPIGKAAVSLLAKSMLKKGALIDTGRSAYKYEINPDYPLT